MTMTQVVNLFKKKSPGIEYEQTMEMQEQTQNLEAFSEDVVNYCNGCNVFNAKLMEMVQVVNVKIGEENADWEGGFRADLFAEGISNPYSEGKYLNAASQVINLNLCNGCSIFNAVNISQNQIIN